MTALRSLERDGQIGFEDTAVVERDPDGTAHVRNEVKTTLRPGCSALFLVVRQSNADAVLAAIRQYRGDVIQTTLDSEADVSLVERVSRDEARLAIGA